MILNSKFFSKYLSLSFLLLVLFLNDASRADSVSCRLLYSGLLSSFRVTTKDDLFKIISDGKNSLLDIADSLRHSNNTEAADLLLDLAKESIKNDEIVSISFLGGGVNSSYKVQLSSGLFAVYKPVNPDRKNQIYRETAAYKLSRAIGLDIVPPTTIRKLGSSKNIPENLRGVKGSIQLFMIPAAQLQKGNNHSVLLDGKEFVVENYLSGMRLRVFDWLINNHDRGSNAGNYLFSRKTQKIIGIDNSVAFVGHDKQARKDKVPFYHNSFLNDTELYERFSRLNKETIEQALDGLNPTRVNEFIERYNILMQDFRKILFGSM